MTLLSFSKSSQIITWVHGTCNHHHHKHAPSGSVAVFINCLHVQTNICGLKVRFYCRQPRCPWSVRWTLPVLHWPVCEWLQCMCVVCWRLGSRKWPKTQSHRALLMVGGITSVHGAWCSLSWVWPHHSNTGHEITHEAYAWDSIVQCVQVPCNKVHQLQCRTPKFISPPLWPTRTRPELTRCSVMHKHQYELKKLTTFRKCGSSTAFE